MKSKRILLYAVNGLGMGHITRLLSIAKYLRRYIYLLGWQPEIVFLSTSEVDTLPFMHNFPVFKIPSKTIVKKGGMEAQRYHKLAKMMIWNCIATHDPHILVVDTFPTGSFDELYDVMDFGYQKVFIYRPRKDKKKLWKNPILKAYDSILYINESHELDNTIEEWIEDKTQHLQTIVQRNKSEMLAKPLAAQQLGLDPNKKTACILAGGGGDKSNEAFFKRILSLTKDMTDIQFVIGAGPLYRGAEIPSKHAKWFYRADISLYWNAFDFVIAAGGYNTVNELLHAQIPTLFFPQNRLYDDQEARIHSLFQQGLCLQFSIEESDTSIQKSIAEIATDTVQKTIKVQLKKYDLQNDAPEAALNILQRIADEATIQKIDELLDMQFLQKFLLKGIEERTICKSIYALTLFQNRINEDNNISEENYIEEEAIFPIVDSFLEEVLLHKIPKNTILPIIFTAIKEEKTTSLEELLDDLIHQIKQTQTI